MPDPIDIAVEPPDADLVYANDLKTCVMLGVVPVSRERAFGLIQDQFTSFR